MEKHEISIGIDTGGTCTDAVIYDLTENRLIASAKALTTRDDLKRGIENALRQLPEEELKKAGSLALSTTLATNACVENKGGHARLIFIGVSRKTFEETGKSYGIDNPEDVCFLDCHISIEEGQSTEPDWKKFREDIPEITRGVTGVSIVQLYSGRFAGNYEVRAREILKEYFDGPVILGRDLFSDLNAIRRGAGALLNARLIPVIQEFLEAVKVVFASYGADVPPVIVRSDASLMNEEMTRERPVETLLCGPAASILGAMHLSDEQNAIIVDMGGTTTDVAFADNRVPRTVKDGIRIGNWKTFVKGMFVDTFGLGGDTAVHFDSSGKLYLEEYRIIPLSVLASEYPSVTLKLRKLAEERRPEMLPLHEFLVLVKRPEEPDESECPGSSPAGGRFSRTQISLCRLLEDGPLTVQEAAAALGKSVYNIHTEELEREGILIRSGLTPTDAMILKGDYDAYGPEAAGYAAKYLQGLTGISAHKIPDIIYDLVCERLYTSLVRILMETEPDRQMKELIERSYRQAPAGAVGQLSVRFQTDYVLLGVGAPTHVFLPKIAGMLGTVCVPVPHAEVANAIGAAAGNVVVHVEAEIMPVYTSAGVDHYNVYLREGQEEFSEYEDARQCAVSYSVRYAKEEARRRGACEELTADVRCTKNDGGPDGPGLLLSEKYRITVRGRMGKGTKHNVCPE